MHSMICVHPRVVRIVERLPRQFLHWSAAVSRGLPLRLPGLHGIAPLRLDAATLAALRDLPPLDAASMSHLGAILRFIGCDYKTKAALDSSYFFASVHFICKALIFPKHCAADEAGILA